MPREAQSGVWEGDLLPEIREALTFQQYGRAPVIEGVRVRPRTKHHGENGWFGELLRLDGGVPLDDELGSSPIRQLSASHAEPGRINAFHLHPRREQNELWTVLQGSLMVWLADCRAASATAGLLQQVLLTSEAPAWLVIPTGVAHGYRAGRDGALLLYAMDAQFDAGDPNEGRLPWDHFGAGIWDEDRG